jgi:hypothetical protein
LREALRLVHRLAVAVAEGAAARGSVSEQTTKHVARELQVVVPSLNSNPPCLMHLKSCQGFLLVGSRWLLLPGASFTVKIRAIFNDY